MSNADAASTVNNLKMSNNYLNSIASMINADAASLAIDNLKVSNNYVNRLASPAG